MFKKIKEKLLGKKITLKLTRPDIAMASVMFKTIDENRKHLRPWLAWEKGTKRVEDSLKYLLNKEEETAAGKKIDYGIYIGTRYIGNIGIFDIDEKNKSGEIGYWLSSKFARKGYITEAVRVLERELFTNRGFNRIQIKCDERNIASAGVAKKCGYVLEGKRREDSYSDYFKDFRNTLVFSKLKSDFKKQANRK